MPLGPLPPIHDVCRISVRGNNAGLAWANVFHASVVTESLDTAELDNFADNIMSDYHAHMMAHVENEVRVTDVTVTCLDSDIAPQGAAAGSMAGAYSGQPYPAQVAVCISWKQALRYRGGHPRNYLPGIPLAAGADNHSLSPVYIASYLADANAFLAAINARSPGGNPCALGMVSYIKNKIYRVPPLFFPYASAQVHGRLDTQRRRLGREAA